MQVSYFDVTVPVFIRNLNNLKHILKKGEAYAKEHNLSEEDLLNERLYEDMFPLVRQVQIATDNAKAIPARLAGFELLKLEDNETTCAELYRRIDTVVEYLKGFSPEQFENAEQQKITLPYFGGKYFMGKDYVFEYALANFFFHFNMTYAILRSIGVPLGKADYLGALTLHEV